MQWAGKCLKEARDAGALRPQESGAVPGLSLWAKPVHLAVAGGHPGPTPPGQSQWSRRAAAIGAPRILPTPPATPPARPTMQKEEAEAMQ